MSRIAGLAWLAVVCLLASGCDVSVEHGPVEDEGDATFHRAGIPVSFQYPASLRVDDQITIAGSGGTGRPPADTVGLVAGKQDMILIQRFPLYRAVDQASLPTDKAEFDRIVGRLAGTPPQDGATGTMAGLPSLTYDASRISSGDRLLIRPIFLFDGDQEIQIGCQSTEGSDRIPQACERMLATLVRS